MHVRSLTQLATILTKFRTLYSMFKQTIVNRQTIFTRVEQIGGFRWNPPENIQRLRRGGSARASRDRGADKRGGCPLSENRLP